MSIFSLKTSCTIIQCFQLQKINTDSLGSSFGELERAMVVDTILSSGENSWLLDSDVTHYIIDDENIFHQSLSFIGDGGVTIDNGSKFNI